SSRSTRHAPSKSRTSTRPRPPSPDHGAIYDCSNESNCSEPSDKLYRWPLLPRFADGSAYYVVSFQHWRLAEPDVCRLRVTDGPICAMARHPTAVGTAKPVAGKAVFVRLRSARAAAAIEHYKTDHPRRDDSKSGHVSVSLSEGLILGWRDLTGEKHFRMEDSDPSNDTEHDHRRDHRKNKCLDPPSHFFPSSLTALAMRAN